ncbi:MAG: carboxypeptidase [Anaerolineae bacterium UTCFX2]|jgi:carboxypeptidase Taq|nr:carboxypeptidase M32 [Anaerolineae bacterium]MCZ7551348.1 carboxypeptidase M32 [Anaerolineales bacterium]OQY88381.1 MAG: carboxypeptidase [Anaerolineae bacterium UTCFX2]
MKEKMHLLRQKLIEADDLEKAAAVLSWDQSTYMPPGGAAARARQTATLAQLAQEKFTDPAIGKLLDELTPYAESLPYDSDDAALIRVTRRQYERMTRIPAEFVGKMSEHTSQAYAIWAEARPANDFARVQPYLEKTLDLSRQLAEFFPGYEHIIDPLVGFSDYGMKASSIRRLFAELRKELVPIVQAITAQPPADDSCLRKRYPQDQQLALGKEVASQIGYDFQRGRLDLTHHPFETNFAVGDVRITTRVKENLFGECLFGVIHESGHAMYEQGVRPELDGTPLGGGTSSGVHESQSRLWENLVGRSRNFCEFFYPRFQAMFPEQLGDVPLEAYYRAINKVERSLIRTDADEVTYNLHVMLRFDFEMDLLEGKLAVKHLPEAWNERFLADIGIQPQDDKDGCMQDVHWYGGLIGGAFQGYTLGNILSGLFYEAALKDHPDIPAQIRQGQFDTLRNWMTEHIYQHGSKFTADELVMRITGGPIRIEPYIQYLRTKYGELYDL